MERDEYVLFAGGVRVAKRGEEERGSVRRQISGPPPPYRIMPAWVVKGIPDTGERSALAVGQALGADDYSVRKERRCNGTLLVPSTGLPISV